MAALPCMMHGCAAITLADPRPDQQAEALSHYDRRFGALSSGRWIGTSAGAQGPIPFVIDWCRAEYSNYDIMQTNGYFRDRAGYVAQLTLEERLNGERVTICLAGDSAGHTISLWEVPLPPATVFGDADARPVGALCDYVTALNASLAESAPCWHTMCLQVNDGGPLVNVNILAGSSFAAMSPANAYIRQILKGPIDRSAWIGTSHDKADATDYHYFHRCVLLSRDGEWPSDVSPPQDMDMRWESFGFLSTSNRDRRLEGAMPPSSRWRSREQFICFIHKTQDMGIESLDDPLPVEVQELLEHQIGQVITGECLRNDAQEIFGTWEAMIAATCRLAEVNHRPVFATAIGDRRLLLSLQWYHPIDQSSPWLYAFRISYIPDERTRVFHNGLIWARFPLHTDKIKLIDTPIMYSWFNLN